jgi:hypothetical protein
MALTRVIKTTLTILSGQTLSNVLNSWNTFGNSAGCIMYSPATLPETVKITISPTTNAVSGDGSFIQIQDGSPLADVTVPAAGKALYFDRLVLAGSIQLVAGTAVAADRVFPVTFQAIYEGY